jgi:heptaprenyl diphosphate synthase
MPQLTNRKLTWLALLVTIGLIIFMIESIIPRPLPWFKPGLANIATLVALYLFGLPEALIVSIIRVFLSALLTGSLFNPAFVLSFGGSIFAALCMGATIAFASRYFSIVGVSIIGAVVHNLVQIILVAWLILQHSGMLYLLPLLVLTAIPTGIFVALISHTLLVYLHKHLLA